MKTFTVALRVAFLSTMPPSVLEYPSPRFFNFPVTYSRSDLLDGLLFDFELLCHAPRAGAGDDPVRTFVAHQHGLDDPGAGLGPSFPLAPSCRVIGIGRRLYPRPVPGAPP